MTSDNIPPTVAVLGGDPVVGKAMEAMLTDAGYDALFFATPPMNGSRHLLDGAQVLLLAPGINATERDAFLGDRTRTPVLELVTILDKAHNGRSGRVPWPAGVEEFGKELDTFLLNGADRLRPFTNL